MVEAPEWRILHFGNPRASLSHLASDVEADRHSRKSISYVFSACYIRKFAGKKLAQLLCMLTTTMLSHISKTIAQGRPLWGLLLANQYLKPSDLLRLALRQRALDVIVRCPQRVDWTNAADGEIAQEILAGKTLAALPPRTRQFLRESETAQVLPPKRLCVFAPTIRRSRRRLLCSRTRTYSTGIPSSLRIARMRS